MSRETNFDPDRREFLKSTAVAAGSVLVANMTLLQNVHAAGNGDIRVGLIGCGARGRGAVDDCLSASKGIKLVAMGDAFKDRLEFCKKKLDVHGDKVDVPSERTFIGLDAYQKLLACDVNYVILTTPPGFRPLHIEAAIAAGKHVFCEKPVAVDATGVRRVMRAAQDAQAKGLGIVPGTQRRHQKGYLEAFRRVHDGDIGEIVAARCYWMQGHLGVRERKPSWSDLEYQIRNWLYFTWLSGDHIVEQHVHNLDAVNWAMKSHPVRAVAMGGRQVRTAPKYGHIFDHFATDFEYENGAHLMSMCRQIDGCEQQVGEVLVGTEGTCTTDGQSSRYAIKGKKPWKFEHGADNLPYQQEHADLIASIRDGKPLNQLQPVAESTLSAIMGRMSAYTGKAITWHEALSSKEDLMPPNLSLDMKLPDPVVAMPGTTQTGS
jgi:myo-inositol 2-dehydrogenase/D-chiro-inositol 1-dehydrogenase